MGIIIILSYRRHTSVDKWSLFGISSMYLSSPLESFPILSPLKLRRLNGVYSRPK